MSSETRGQPVAQSPQDRRGERQRFARLDMTVAAFLRLNAKRPDKSCPVTRVIFYIFGYNVEFLSILFYPPYPSKGPIHRKSGNDCILQH